MRRREFVRTSSISVAGLGFCAPVGQADERVKETHRKVLGSAVLGNGDVDQAAENIIFLVSDGMSCGTLQMADLLSMQKFGKQSQWLRLYERPTVRRALMDTASANSWVTDSAAASSSWGGGVRVNNGSLNVDPSGKHVEPILQKFKKSGKAVGCVTSVPITHATPAGFCVSNQRRGDQSGIAEQYLKLRFDVMLGGGLEFFDPSLRDDGKDLLSSFEQDGYRVARNRQDLGQIPSGDAPVLGVFHESGFPYALDHQHDPELAAKVPTLPEMTRFAIDRLKQSPNGFVLQVEAGKVDWAAHANDAAGLLYDQLAFDEALAVALEFADQNQRTLVIVTTDHGNANPGLIGTSGSNEKFERAVNFRHSTEWVFRGLSQSPTNSEITERIEYAMGVAIAQDEANQLQDHFKQLSAEDRTNPYKLPFALLAGFMQQYTGIGWSGDDHSGDYVELAMIGPGSQLLPHFIKNTQLHQLMLKAAQVAS
jgi:alkaline phosphatase